MRSEKSLAAALLLGVVIITPAAQAAVSNTITAPVAPAISGAPVQLAARAASVPTRQEQRIMRDIRSHNKKMQRLNAKMKRTLQRLKRINATMKRR